MVTEGNQADGRSLQAAEYKLRKAEHSCDGMRRMLAIAQVTKPSTSPEALMSNVTQFPGPDQNSI